MTALPLHQFPSAELQAMRLDGDLVAVGPGERAKYSPIDVPLDAASRADLLAPDVPNGFIAARETAAWVYDGLCSGNAIEVVSRRRRRSPKSRRDLAVRYVRVSDAEIATIDRLRVTSIPRTIVDLAAGDRCDPRRLEELWAHASAAHGADWMDAAVQAMLRSLTRRRGAPQAAARLRALVGPERWDRA